MNPIDPIAYLEQTYSIKLDRVSSDEYAGPCPWCGGVDRFHVWQSKANYWCRPGMGHCGKQGFIDELTGEKLTSDERAILAIATKQRQMEREQEEQDRRLTALEQMANSTDHLQYHELLDLDRMEYWLDEGMTVDTIAKYKLGYCGRCPTDRDGRASFTIPVYGRDGETLTNIRHRLLGGAGGDKYRPHMAGLGAQLFNARFTTAANGKIVVTEGEKKSIVLDQEGFASVGIMGQRSFKREWIEWLEPFSTVYVALDPDAQESAQRLAGMFGDRGKVVSLPVKADDFFSRWGGTADDFRHFVKRGTKPKSD